MRKLSQDQTLELIRVLKDDGYAETRLVEIDGEKWVHKTFRFRFWWGRALLPLARRWMRHEVSISMHLAGIEGVAAEVMAVDDRSFLRRWVEGIDLKAAKRRGQIPAPRFFEELGGILERIHARGVAYVDLAKMDNVIVTPAGQPVLLDFQISVKRYEGRSRLRRALSNWWLPRLQREDLRHLAKLRRHVRRRLDPPELAAADRRRSFLNRLYHGLIGDPFHAVARLAYPKGSNETFRFAPRRRAPREEASAPGQPGHGPPSSAEGGAAASGSHGAPS
jgi:predicted Ser/Thr protein kinase